MRSSLGLAIAAMATALMSTGSAQAADVILHYTFTPGSYFDLGGTVETVTGSFDYDVTNPALENVQYNRGGDIFTVGSLDYGSAQPIFGVFDGGGGADYDVYQLTNSLALGGIDPIVGGTHPAVVVYGAGVAVSTVAGVPEPATWALMLVGFAMTGAALRRRTSAAATVYA